MWLSLATDHLQRVIIFCLLARSVPRMTCRQLGAPVVVPLLALALLSSCGRRVPPSPQDTPAIAPRPDAPPPEAPPVAEPVTLLALPISAYHASLAVDDDGVAFLLTSGAVYRLPPGGAPAATPLPLGFGATTTPSSFVYWSRGALFKAPKAGGAPRRLVGLAAQPQRLLALGEDVAWLARAGDGRFALHALRGKKPVAVYTSPGSIDAVNVVGEWIVFAERPAGADWRIGRVRATGGAPEFTALRPGRVPAMLLGGRDDVTFYDGNRLEVHRLSLDLQRERTLASGFICSPVAVAKYVTCVQPEGIFELRPDERPRRLVPGSTARLVTEIAATPKRLLWVVDAGADKLELRALPLLP
jgi:hypothetical protein